MEGLLLLVLAALLFGDRLPEYSRTLADWVKRARVMSEDAKTRLKEEVPEISDVDWRRMDPRQYDPRRIIKDALMEDLDPAAAGQGDPHGQSMSPHAQAFDTSYTDPASAFVPLPKGQPAPFDSEAT
jgi:sec-independent protein translocase protein TatB